MEEFSEALEAVPQDRSNLVVGSFGTGLQKRLRPCPSDVFEILPFFWLGGLRRPAHPEPPALRERLRPPVAA